MRIKALVLATCLAAPGVAHAQEAPRFSLPLDCTIGKDCWVQNLVDMDRQNGMIRDPFCGRASFDTHKGTDIRVATNAELERGIEILAMADGVVAGGRNNMDDALVTGPETAKKVRNVECGNGIIMEHGGGWTTQYCHLKKGSLRVKKGDRIKRGDVIGLMGLSGYTTFPHIHVTFRKGKTVLDPMTGAAQGAACSVEAGLGPESLWDDRARAQISGASTALLSMGFANTPVSTRMAMSGTVEKASRKGPFLFFAYLMNLRPGDRVELEITGPKGVWVSSTSEPLEAVKAQHTFFAGRKRMPESGTYRGRVRLFREGRAIVEEQSEPITF